MPNYTKTSFQGTELSISQSLYDGNTVKLHCSQTTDVKNMVTKAYQWNELHLTSLKVLSLFFLFIYWPLHTKGKWAAKLVKTHSARLFPNLLSWTAAELVILSPTTRLCEMST